MLMMSGVYEQDSNVTQLGNLKLETIHYQKNKGESSDVWIFKFDKSGLKSGSHIRPGPDLKKRPDSGRGRGRIWYPVQPYYKGM